MSGDKFDWIEAKREGIIAFPTVAAIAVYCNADGDIVIRQESTLGEEDSAVIFPVRQAEAVIERIRALVAEH